MRSIKSQKALSFVDTACAQVPIMPELLSGELRATIHIWYASERPDLDESVILDVLQGRVYKNDRQIRERHVYHAIDRDNPRSIIEIMPRT